MDRFLDAIHARVAAHVNQIAQPRCATVQAFDPTNHAVRVAIQPEGLLTGWMPLGAVAVGSGTGIVAPPAIGDQVLVVPQEGDSEHWHVVSRIFSQVAMPPVSPATNKPVQSGEVGVFTNGAYLHVSGGTIYAQASQFKLHGNLVVDGSISSTSGDVSDQHGSLDRLRGNYDRHTHSSLSSPPTPQDSE
ncbi:phage baseplate assembly protein V [Endobacter medicaginis]